MSHVHTVLKCFKHRRVCEHIESTLTGTVPEITPGHPDGHGKKTTLKNTSKPKQPVSAAASKLTPEDQQGNDDFDERLISTLTIQ